MVFITFCDRHITRRIVAQQPYRNRSEVLEITFSDCIGADSDALIDLVNYDGKIELSILNSDSVVEACLSDLCLMMRSGKVTSLWISCVLEISPAFKRFLESIEFSSISNLRAGPFIPGELVSIIKPPPSLNMLRIKNLRDGKTLQRDDLYKFLPYITHLSIYCPITPDALKCLGESKILYFSAVLHTWEGLVDILRTNLTIEEFHNYIEPPPDLFRRIWINPVIQRIHVILNKSIWLNQPRSKEVVCSRVVQGLKKVLGGDLLRPLCAMLFDL